MGTKKAVGIWMDQSADKMTDNEKVAFVRDHFKKK